jgi:hypothetical protein
MNLARLYDERLCPACGFKLDFTPWKDGLDQEKPCPCCGLHFGHDDADESRRETVYHLLRQRWIEAGRRWWAKGEPPKEYDPPSQLARLEQFENHTRHAGQ